jgi:membrane-associated phospholipid phosphatase
VETGPTDRGASPIHGSHASRLQWVSEARTQAAAVDQAAFDAVETTPTPALDRALVRVSDAANYSRLWLATAAAVALVGGRQGRRGAVQGVVAIGLASAMSNLVIKPLFRRRRPPVSTEHPVVSSRRVRRPASASFPSGHTASAFAFASAMGEAVPVLWVPLHVTASVVGYARVHTGVHYPSDVIVGALVGASCGWTTRRLVGRLAPPGAASTQCPVHGR